MLGMSDGPGVTVAALALVALSLFAFVAWNCVVDMLRPPHRWIDRAAHAVAERFGGRLPTEKRAKLRATVRSLIANAAGPVGCRRKAKPTDKEMHI